MNTVIRIARFGMRDVLRSRWLVSYAGFFALCTWSLLQFSDTPQKALLALVSIVLFIVPLASIVFGTMHFYGSREFVHLLLAQPVPRRQLFTGLYLGLALPLAASVVAGILTPMLLLGAPAPAMRLAGLMCLVAVALSAACSGLATVIAYRIDDRARGLASALAIWLLLAVAWDGLTLMLATRFANYPIERTMLVAMIANPIDLGRLLLILQFDVAALLGYTGAVFRRFFEGTLGIAIAATALLLWTTAPAIAGARLFHRKDF